MGSLGIEDLCDFSSMGDQYWNNFYKKRIEKDSLFCIETSKKGAMCKPEAYQ